MNPAGKFQRFLDDQRGMVTYLALVVVLLVILFSGMSLDTANARHTRQVLQTAADAAASAAVMDLPDQKAALETALKLANANLTGASIDSAVTPDGVIFGRWDSNAKAFSATTTNPNAIAIKARRTKAGSNPLPTMLLRYVGFTSWNVQAESVAYRDDKCTSPDIASDGTISFTSNNAFYKTYCLSAKAVRLSRNNTFDDANRIYVPDLKNLTVSGGLSTNIGRGTNDSSASLTYRDIASKSSTLTNGYVSNIDALAANYLDPTYAFQPSYINTSAAVITIKAKRVKSTEFIPGRIYHVVCGGSKGSKAQFYRKSEVSKIVMVSDCKIQVGTRSELKDVVLVSRQTGSKSTYIASRVQLGDDDHCAAGGGVSIYTAGDFTSASGMKGYGLSISALGNVHIAAKSNGLAGLKINAKGDVSFSAKAKFGTCKGAATNVLASTYAMVQ